MFGVATCIESLDLVLGLGTSESGISLGLGTPQSWCCLGL